MFRGCIISDHNTHRALKPHNQTIKVVVHVVLHCHDIVERMHFSTIQSFDIVAETLQNCQNSARIVLLDRVSISQWCKALNKITLSEELPGVLDTLK